jgi:hypothetical protein
MVAGAATGIFIFLFGEFGQTQRNLLLSTLVIGGFSLTGLGSTVGAGTRWLWPARPLGLAASLVGLALVLLLIWGLVDNDERNLKLAGTLVVVACTSAQVSLLGLLRPANRWVLLWSLGTILAALGLAYLIIGGMWGHINPDSEQMYLRWIGVVAILDVTGSIGLFPLSRLLKASRGSAGSRRRPNARRLRPSRSRR